MTASQWWTILGGLAAIAWVNWYFFLAPRSTGQATASAGRQEIEIVVRGGYDPAVVRVKRGIPLRLVFDRQDSSSCSEEIVLADFGIRQFLPAGHKTSIDLTPRTGGEFEITCGMSMLHGKLVVEG